MALPVNGTKSEPTTATTARTGADVVISSLSFPLLVSTKKFERGMKRAAWRLRAFEANQRRDVLPCRSSLLTCEPQERKRT